MHFPCFTARKNKHRSSTVNILFVDIDLIEYNIKCRNVNGNLDKKIQNCVLREAEKQDKNNCYKA